LCLFEARIKGAEDRARSLQAEVERLARQSPAEWLFWLSRSAADHGVEEAKLKQMVEAQVRVNEKKKREAEAEERKREQRAEKQRAAERRDQDRQQRAQEQAAEKAKKATEREAGRKQREREKEFAKLLRVPSAEQDQRLVALARRLEEDKLGLEGTVSKRCDSRYVSGRSLHWIKVRNPNSPAARRLEARALSLNCTSVAT
jgi:DNA polymerase III alpha subunit (gram-positive type)